MGDPDSVLDSSTLSSLSHIAIMAKDYQTHIRLKEVAAVAKGKETAAKVARQNFLRGGQ
jgi:hypothetical protein